MDRVQPTFECFLMTNVSARSNLVNFCPEKNLTQNRPKPIGVLTRTKSSHSDLRLPLGYLLPDFQPHRSNFFAPPPPPALTRKEGGRHVGGAPPPQTPPGGIVLIGRNEVDTLCFLSHFIKKSLVFTFVPISFPTDVLLFILKFKIP